MSVLAAAGNKSQESAEKILESLGHRTKLLASALAASQSKLLPAEGFYERSMAT